MGTFKRKRSILSEASASFETTLRCEPICANVMPGNSRQLEESAQAIKCGNRINSCILTGLERRLRRFQAMKTNVDLNRGS